MHPHVHAFQVQQHPRENLRFGGVAAQARLEQRAIVDLVVGIRVPAEQLAAGVLGQECPAVERVDDQVFGVGQPPAGRTSQQEVSWEIDALYVQARAPRHFHVEQRQRNRDAGAALQHLVEEAVAGILVLVLVADEVQLVEQVFVERHHACIAIGVHPRRRFARHDGRGGHADAGLASERVELIEIRAGIELRVLDPRDHQRRDREIGVRAEGGVREAANELLAHAQA